MGRKVISISIDENLADVLNQLQRAGISKSEVINQCLAQGLKQHLEGIQHGLLLMSSKNKALKKVDREKPF